MKDKEKLERGYAPSYFTMDDIPYMTEAQRVEFLKMWEEYLTMLNTPIKTDKPLIYGTDEG